MMIGQEQSKSCLAVAALAALAPLAIASAAIGAGGVPDYDFDWATIGDPGNEPYQGQLTDVNVGTNRGTVDYNYRMSKLEVSSGQWFEFMNTFSPLFGDPTWGEPGNGFGFWDTTGHGSYRPFHSQADLVPVQGITWRQAAMYANWLHNDKAATIAAISDGAYDVSTFNIDSVWLDGDQVAHHPDAKFWIPTLDEWLKAAHYDPNKDGLGEAGWWQYTTTSDTLPVPGPPGEGETSADNFAWSIDDIDFDGSGTALIPLGSYPEITSPWGLLDTSGGAGEWTEEIVHLSQRAVKGSFAGGSVFQGVDVLEHIDIVGGLSPGSGGWAGLRLASAIPNPGNVILVILFFSRSCLRRTRDEKESDL